MKFVLIVIIVTTLCGCNAVRIAPPEMVRGKICEISSKYSNDAEALRYYFHERLEGYIVDDKDLKLTDILDIPDSGYIKEVGFVRVDDRIVIKHGEQTLKEYPVVSSDDYVSVQLESSRGLYVLVNHWMDRVVTLFLDVDGNLLVDRSEWGGGMVLILASGRSENWHYRCRKIR